MQFSMKSQRDLSRACAALMVRRRLFWAFFLLFFTTGTLAQEVPLYQSPPKFYEFGTNVFDDLPLFFEKASPRDHWREYLGILSLSGVLIYYDQKMLEGSQKFAKHINLIDKDGKESRSRRVATTKVGGINADLRVPSDLNSAFYFIGDGLTSLSIIGGLAIAGGLNGDNRALNTASQVMESMLLTGMFVITGKYLFGRESPAQESTPGGAWHPAPGVRNYLAKVSKHDAFPSGHVATAMSTLMVLHYNYPEKEWLLPAGYSAVGLLMFAMLNNGVHWAGDYPLGLGIGYVAATTVFAMRRPQEMNSPGSGKASAGRTFQMLPFVEPQGVGLMVELRR